MAVKKKVKTKSKRGKRSAKRSVKDLSARKSKSVKGGLLPAVNVAQGTQNVSPQWKLTTGRLVVGDGSV
jgi:hypothetical protein